MSSTQTDTRERILEATLHLMEQHRGQGVRLEDIARQAGVSRQALYLHFGSRTELLIATTRYLDKLKQLPDRIQQIVDAENPVQSLDVFIEVCANYIPEVYGLAKALMNARETDESAATAWNEWMGELYQGCLISVQCLARDQVLHPMWTVEAAADYLWAALSVGNWEILTIGRGWTNAQYIERMQQALKLALLRRE
jgi:AcrR family transcriptional regulator